MTKTDEIIKQLENKVSDFFENEKAQNVGIVEKNNDGVVIASGLSKAMIGEIVSLKKGKSGVVLNLDEDNVSIILLGRGDDVKEGDTVKTTGELLSINASEQLLGRVINPLGEPLDGKARIKKGKQMPLERIAAGVVEREPVN